METKGTKGWKPGDPIGYIRSEIPEFDVPPYAGERYEAMVPDTLDLQERARLVIHSMTESTDPLADHEPYYVVCLRPNPPTMIHNSWHGSTFAKFVESTCLMRIVSGSDQNSHVDHRWMEVALKSQGPDGLIYTPFRGRPWSHWGCHMHKPMREEPICGVSLPGDHQISAFGNGRMLSAMSLLAKRDGGATWRKAVERLVDGLRDLAVDAEDFAYFWPRVDNTAKGEPSEPVKCEELGDIDGYSHVVHGLVHAHQLLDYPPALELARKLITYMRRYYYAEDGSFLNKPGDPIWVHFHAHTNGLLSILKYALEVGDGELSEFVLRTYERAKDYVVSYDMGEAGRVKNPGGNLIGYFPENVNNAQWEGMEICQVADMITLAMELSDSGIADRWDDADRWIRNVFAEGQLLSTDWLYRLAGAGWKNPRPTDLAPSLVGSYCTTDKVPERSLGAFAGWSAANDWYVGNGMGIMHCCTVNGARAIYWIWQHMLRREGDKLRLNLLLNHSSPWADIDSYIPYQGRVDIKMKEPADLEVRIPEWTTPEDIRCQVNGEDTEASWSGRYARVGSVAPGDVATLSFPIWERTDVVHIEKERFALVRKGNEVVSIDPPGRHCPLYQRQHYRDSSPRWRNLTRFVSGERIEW